MEFFKTTVCFPNPWRILATTASRKAKILPMEITLTKAPTPGKKDTKAEKFAQEELKIKL